MFSARRLPPFRQAQGPERVEGQPKVERTCKSGCAFGWSGDFGLAASARGWEFGGLRHLQAPFAHRRNAPANGFCQFNIKPTAAGPTRGATAGEQAGVLRLSK
jgi:hypothetical protein